MILVYLGNLILTKLLFLFLTEADSVLVHFKICCPNIEEDTAVNIYFSNLLVTSCYLASNSILSYNYEILLVQIYVIGSSSKLGQWEVNNGIALSYAGDSTWHADCIFQNSDFPFQYPLVFFSL